MFAGSVCFRSTRYECIAGQVPVADFAAATGAEGDWSKGLFPTPSPRHKQFPMDLNIVNF
jgi:hypothetical protein